ncbi:hypothetical protein J4405_01050 [Candidatus Woesearchaeota archaeon]|nr:hypothetical protein [Candidatus Woesearchaeota archaeon]
MKKIYWLSTGLILIIGLVIFSFSNNNPGNYELINNYDGKMEIYKLSTCGCCTLYANYFNNKGNSNIKVNTINNMEAIREEYGIPSALTSCHTTIIGDYFVEGHIPLEAVEKLLREKPSIKGIAMPGMPTGSPGMPGVKSEDFVIYQVNNDGSYTEFMRI